MRTPREILLARHRRLEPKLDQLREQAIAALRDQSNLETHPSRDVSRNSRSFLAELLGFSPKFWIGLASAWMVILALKLSTAEESPVTWRPQVSVPQANLQLRPRPLLLAELIGFPLGAETKPTPLPPPRPHGSRQPYFFKT